MTTSRFLHSNITSTSSFLRLTFFWRSWRCSDCLQNDADTFRNNSIVGKNFDPIELRNSNVIDAHQRAKTPRVEMRQRVTTLAAVVGLTNDTPLTPIRWTTIQFAWSWNLNWKIGNVKLIFQFNFIQTAINVLTDKITSATETSNLNAWRSCEKLNLTKNVNLVLENGTCLYWKR